MVAKMVGEGYDGLSEEKKYERAIGEYRVREEDAQVMPDEDVEFHILEEIPKCMVGGKYEKDPTIEISTARGIPFRIYYIIVDKNGIIGEHDNGNWKVPYKKVENAIQEIKEKGTENVSGRTKLLIDLAKEEQGVEKNRWEGAQWYEVFDYNFRKKKYENLWMIDDVRGKVTREGPWQLGFAVYNEQELCDAILKLPQSKNNK